MSTAAAVGLTDQDAIRAALNQAAVLVRQGWTKGAYCRNRTGTALELDARRPQRVDLAHSLDLAAESYGLEPELLRGLIRHELPEPYHSDALYGLEHWNDHLMRSKIDVIVLLYRVADEYR